MYLIAQWILNSLLIFFPTDDVVKMYINGALVMDGGTQSTGGYQEVYSSPITMVAGTFYDVTLEYSSVALDAMCQIKWQSTCDALDFITYENMYSS